MKEDRTLVLIGHAQQGDKAARDTLFEENVGLVWSVVKRFRNRGVEMDDLFQIGSIGSAFGIRQCALGGYEKSH